MATQYLTIPNLTRKQIERLFAKIEIGDPDGCWIWTGYRDKRGYGRTGYYGCVLVHRLIWAWLVGPLQLGGPRKDVLVLDHFVCSNPSCCNPAHMKLVTNSENVRRSPVAPATINAKKIYCVRGHLLPDPDEKGRRFCRACELIRQREYRERNLEKVRARSREHQRKVRSKKTG